MEKLELIIEESDDGQFWGRVNYNGSLVVESCKTIEELEASMKNLLIDFEGADSDKIQFELITE